MTRRRRGRAQAARRPQRRPLGAGDLDDWLAETHQVAVAYVYAKLAQPPACGQPAPDQTISKAYLDGADPIVREQLARAAVRLARVLNEALS